MTSGREQQGRWAVAVLGAVVLVSLAYVGRVQLAQPGRIEVASLGEGPTQSTEVVSVHVAGEVRSPGVVRVARDARMVDAIDAAGGLTANADAHAVNLAQRVRDGQRIFVPPRSEARSDGPQTPVRLNSASAEELARLPGVGRAGAERVVEHRRRHGPFQSSEDVAKVSGLGKRAREALQRWTTL